MIARPLAIAAVIAAACAGGSALAAEGWDSGVRGRVTVSPTCPGPQRPGESCSAGYETRIRIRSLPDRELVKTIHSGEHGRFRAGLAPGRYRLIANQGNRDLPRCPPVDVTVKPGRFTNASIGCDTGIR